MTQLLRLTLLTLIDALTLMEILFISKLLFGCRLKLNRRNILVLSVVCTVSYFVVIGLLFPSNEEANFFLLLFIMISGTILLSEDRKSKNVLLLIPATLVCVEWANVIGLLERMTGLDHYVLFTLNGTEITPLFCLQDISMLVILYVINRRSDQKLLEIRLTVGEAVFISFFCIFTPFLSFIFEQLEVHFQKKTYTLAWCAFVLILNFAVAYAIINRKRARYYKLLSDNYKTQFSDEYMYFQDYRDRQKDTAQFLHDFKNHVLVMQNMFNAGEYEKSEAYFRELIGEKGSSAPYANNKSRYLTGNSMIDILLAVKDEALTQNGIALTVNGDLSPLQTVAPVDLCIVFSNLLDNAIEANKKYQGKRYIRLHSGKSRALFFLEIENPFSGQISMGHGLPLSTKADREKHGFGLSNAHSIVNKYHGELKLSASHNIFKAQLILPFAPEPVAKYPTSVAK